MQQASYWTVRRKMFLPALVALGALAVATIVTLVLSGNAAGSLRRLEGQEYPVVRFYSHLHDDLKEVHWLLRVVGESEDFTRMDEADDLRDVFTKNIDEDGTKVLGAAEAQRVRAQFLAYYEAARKLAAVRVAAGLHAKRALASKENTILIHSNATPEERAIAAATSEVDNAYIALIGFFEQRVDEAGRAMTGGMAAARTSQVRVIAVVTLLLLTFGPITFVLAWLIAGRTSLPLQTLSAAALRIADGDLTLEVHVETADEVGLLAGSFQRMAVHLRQVVGMLKAAAQELALAAQQLSEHTRAQSAMLERQASGVAETSSTTRELEQTAAVAASRAQSVLEVARRAAGMSETGQQAAERSAGELERIQASVEGIVGQSAGLLDQAHQVSDIVETVHDIATQSHVLSLNASIEAAKAGAAGTSFAVVAQEMRALAEQSGQGATSIAKIVDDILSAAERTRETTERGSKGMAGSLAQVRASGATLREIGSIVRETSDAALQIATAVQQQSTGIGQIAAAMRDVDKGMEETVVRIRALEHSAQQIAETATQISGIASAFTV